LRLYLDSSALVKLYVVEEGSPLVRTAVDRAGMVATSALAYVEARAAFARRRQEGAMTAEDHRRVVRLLDVDWARYAVVEVSEGLIREAARLAERHRLRAYDAIHLASATAIRDRVGEPMVLAAWDQPLEKAAKNEGLGLLRSPRRPPASP
jgi:predicted nucleic acid-binding protein